MVCFPSLCLDIMEIGEGMDGLPSRYTIRMLVISSKCLYAPSFYLDCSHATMNYENYDTEYHFFRGEEATYSVHEGGYLIVLLSFLCKLFFAIHL